LTNVSIIHYDTIHVRSRYSGKIFLKKDFEFFGEVYILLKYTYVIINL